MPADQLCFRDEMTTFSSLAIKDLLSKNLPGVYNVKLPRHLLSYAGGVQVTPHVHTHIVSDLPSRCSESDLLAHRVRFPIKNVIAMSKGTRAAHIIM